MTCTKFLNSMAIVRYDSWCDDPSSSWYNVGDFLNGYVRNVEGLRLKNETGVAHKKPIDHRQNLLWAPGTRHLYFASIKKFWVSTQTVNITVTFMSNNNFKYLNYIEFSSFCCVERSQDVFRSFYIMAIPQGDPDLKTWKSVPDL